MAINTNFPVFAANQVLKNDHLNDLVNYLEEQTRLTRSKTIGIGILCGFQMEWTQATDNLGTQWESLRLTEGVGITSSGYLIHSPDTSFTHHRQYLKTMELSQLEEFMATNKFYEERFNYYRELADIYEFFKNESGDDIEELYELIPVEDNKENSQPLSKTFLNDKVLLVYLNCDLQSLKNCDVNDCDDKGAKLQFDIRYILAPEQVAKRIQQKEKVNTQAHQMPFHLIDRPYSKLKEIYLEKLDFYGSPPVLPRHLFQQYLSRIQEAGNDLYQELKMTFVAFDFLLKDLYSDDRMDHMLSQLMNILKDSKSLPKSNQYPIQYYYDFIAHLIDAYHEFLGLGRQYNTLCHFSDQLFPKHLMIGKLTHIEDNLLNDNEFSNRSPFIKTGEGFFPKAEVKIPYRHRFISSPQNALQQDIAYKMQTLHLKIYEMLIRFKPVLIVKKPMVVLPSQDLENKLSHRDIIPGYFMVSDIDSNPHNKIKRLWSYDKTLKGQLNQIVSYHNPPTIPVLRYRKADAKFYRIEGHIGEELDTVLSSIKKIRSQLGLDFEIKLLDMSDTISSKSIAGLPVNLFSSEIKKHPGLTPMCGVPKGGTFYLAYHSVTTRPPVLTYDEQLDIGNTYIQALGSVSRDYKMLDKSRELVTELSMVTNQPVVYTEQLYQTILNAEASQKYQDLIDTPVFTILKDRLNTLVVNPNNVNHPAMVVGDFALSYVCCDTDFDRSSLGVVECRFPWIDNYQFLNRYSWEGNTKDYEFYVLQYTIGETNIIDNPIKISVKLAAVAHQKLMAILQAINLKFPSGLVLGTDSKNKSNFTIKHFQNQNFTLKLRREGSNDEYTYSDKEWLKNGSRIYKYKSDCRLLPRKYNSLDYNHLHQEYAYSDEFVYEFPPTDKDQMNWSKMLKERRISKFENLPSTVKRDLLSIKKHIVPIDPKMVIGLGGSWKKGSWAIKASFTEEKEFIALRQKITGKSGVSDYDIMIQTDKKVSPQEILAELKLEKLNIIGIGKVTAKNFIIV